MNRYDNEAGAVLMVVFVAVERLVISVCLFAVELVGNVSFACLCLLSCMVVEADAASATDVTFSAVVAEIRFVVGVDFFG